MPIIPEQTIAAVRHAIAALRKVKRLRSNERAALIAALAAADGELTAAVRREYPGLCQWHIPAPTSYRWDPAADGGTGGWRAWKSASQLARAAESWIERGPSYAAARVAQAYGIGKTLCGVSDPSLAIGDHVRNLAEILSAAIPKRIEPSKKAAS